MPTGREEDNVDWEDHCEGVVCRLRLVRRVGVSNDPWRTTDVAAVVANGGATVPGEVDSGTEINEDCVVDVPNNVVQTGVTVDDIMGVQLGEGVDDLTPLDAAVGRVYRGACWIHRNRDYCIGSVIGCLAARCLAARLCRHTRAPGS